MSRDVVEVIDAIKLQLSKKCGVKGIRLLGRAFVVNDRANNALVDFHTFQNVLNKSGVFLARQEASKLYRFYDVNNTESIDYREFIRGLIGEMGERRFNLVGQTFNTLSNGAPTVPVQNVVAAFNAENHPQVLSGQFSAREVFEEFFNSFDGAQPEKQGVISAEEFFDYYTDLSAIYPYGDDTFAQLMSSVWGVREPVSASASIMASQRRTISGIKELIVDKIQQRSKAGGSETDTLRKCFKTFDLDDEGRLASEPFFDALAAFGVYLEDRKKKLFFDAVAENGRVNYLQFTQSLFTVDEGILPNRTAAIGNKTMKSTQSLANTQKTIGKQAQAAQEDSFPAVLFVLGAPGCGKSTQCAIVSDRLGFAHINAEELLMQAYEDDSSAYAPIVRQAVNDGKTVPVEVVVTVIREEMDSLYKQGALNYVVEGFPRSKQHFDAWNDMMGRYCRPPCYVLINVDPKVVQQRPTASEPNFNTKMNIFLKETLALCDTLDANNMLQVVDGSHSIESIAASISDIIANV